VKFVLDLPVAVVETPRKLFDEVRTLIMNDERSGRHGQEAGSSGGT
jgi:hypothetical protein